MPFEVEPVGVIGHVGGKPDRLTVQVIVHTAILPIVAKSLADPKPVVGRHCHIPSVEQGVNV